MSGTEQSVEATRWLDPEERATWLALMELTVKLPAALDAQLERDAGLNLFEYMVLAVLSERPDRTMRMSELAMFSNGSLSRLSHVAKRLEAQGFLRRQPCPGDGRSTNAVLTDAGWAKVVETAPQHVANVRRLVFDAMSAHQHAQLRRASRRILAAVHDPQDCPPWDPDGIGLP